MACVRLVPRFILGSSLHFFMRFNLVFRIFIVKLLYARVYTSLLVEALPSLMPAPKAQFYSTTERNFLPFRPSLASRSHNLLISSSNLANQSCPSHPDRYQLTLASPSSSTKPPPW
jgi:hypothetical protein